MVEREKEDKVDVSKRSRLSSDNNVEQAKNSVPFDKTSKKPGNIPTMDDIAKDEAEERDQISTAKPECMTDGNKNRTKKENPIVEVGNGIIEEDHNEEINKKIEDKVGKEQEVKNDSE